MQKILQDFTAKFKNVPKNSIEKFLSLATEETYKKNEFISKIGETSKDFYIIKSGIVRSYYCDEKGKQSIRTIFTANKTTGSLASLISKRPSILNYDCLTDCVLYKFNFNELKTLIATDINIASLYSTMLEYLFLHMESRIYDLTLLNATEKYLKLKAEIPDIEKHIAQYHIASYLNITAVQLSRIRKEIYSK
jgi:CRP-like cAMP-binding protein